MQPGDILLYRVDGIINNLIAKAISSKYSHAGIYYGEINDRDFFAEVDWLPSSLKPLDSEERSYDVYRVKNITKEQQNLIQENIIKHLGVEYDYGQLLSFPLKLLTGMDKLVFNNPNKYICTEFVDIIYREVDIQLLKDEPVGILTPKQIAQINKTYQIAKSRKGDITYIP